jgi:hypothetical protein
MTAEDSAKARMAPSSGGDCGSGQPLTGEIASRNSPRRAAAAPDGGHRRLRHGPRVRSSSPPDLGELARNAVVSFLHDASIATAEREATRTGGAMTDVKATATTPAGDAVRDDAREAPSHFVAESAAWRAAAASVSALDRIEAVAAKVEADIAAALQAHAELQAGAGTAAEAAVRAAQSAWIAAHSAVEADSRATVALRRVEHYVSITVALVVIAMILLVVSATPVH